MKKITAKLATFAMLIFSIVFGSLSINTFSPSLQDAYAIDNPPSISETDPDFATSDTSDVVNGDINSLDPENAPSDTDKPADFAPGNDEITNGDIKAPETIVVEDPDAEGEEKPEKTSENICSEQTGILSWGICPAVQTVANAVDGIYNIISNFLVVEPLTMNNQSPIYIVWQYARNITNIVFVIFLIIVIYSQLTGLGINNYGVKRILPRLIIAVILVNLSFLICSIAVDISNIAGANLHDFFLNTKDTMLASSDAFTELGEISFGDLATVILGGGSIASLLIGITGGFGHFFWMIVIALLGGLISVVIGLLTVAARQAVVALLIMIAPLAFVAYLLPNTERWFTKWKDLLARMLVFYPMFSVLFGASQLAGWAVIASAKDGFGIILGLAIQVVPLFFSFSLMKMSGTILGSLNVGLHRLAAPLQRTATGWGMEHAERSRQNYFANSTSGSARLREYLDYRQKLRLMDTKTAMDIRSHRADTRAYMKMSSEDGRDELENDRIRVRPNHYTRNAKRASIYSTRMQTAQLYHANTVSAYKFNNAVDRKLIAEGGQAYIDYSTQRYREANEAQSDQTWLLNQYINANTHRFEDPAKYNRLIRNGAGSLGHLGETSIMGQVITVNAQIEERRRREGRIVFTKFGMNKHKQELRGAAFDCDIINDDGYETDEFGNAIQDEFYEYKIDPNTGQKYKHRHWQRYIGVHKVTGEEITKAQYDALNDNEKKNYKRVNYFDITTDDGRPIQRVYTDDAGYMKELLVDDIAIGDPINERYELSIGIGKNGKTDGILRSYHSTISAALGHDYKEHDASTTAQIIAQLNNGSVNNIGQLWIAKLESLKNAARPGPILLNDERFLKQFAKMLSTVRNPELAAQVFSDEVLAEYENVNRVPLHGAQLVTHDDGTQSWEKIDRYTEGITSQQKRDFVLHMMIPEVAQKLFTSLNRKVSPNISERQKAPTLTGLHALLDELIVLHDQNLNEDIDINQRLNPDPKYDVYNGGDPNSVKARIDAIPAIQEKQRQTKRRNNGNNGDNNTPPDGGTPPSGGGGGGNGGGTPPSTGGSGGHGGSNTYTSASGRTSYTDFGNGVRRNFYYKEQRKKMINTDQVYRNVEDLASLVSSLGVEEAAGRIADYYDTLGIPKSDYDLTLQQYVDDFDENSKDAESDFINKVIDLTEQLIAALRDDDDD